MPTELTQKTSSTIQLLENLRHDVRTSLIGVLGLAQSLQSQLKNTAVATQSDTLVFALTACLEFQTQLLDDIIGNACYQDTFCLRSLIEKAINLVSPRALLKNLIIDFYYEDVLPMWVDGNALRLFQIVHELLTNAIKFTNEGKIVIRLSMQDKQNQQFILCGEISDTGIGIPEHEKESIFQRFYRIPLDQAGSGIGLSQVKNAIHELDGRCEIQSSVGQGTTFFFYLPMVMSNENLAPDFNLQNKRFDNITVLLIEDHPVTAIAIQQMLLALGCCVEVVRDAESALIQVQKKTYHLIMMDLHLPDMSGSNLIDQICNSKNKINKNTPIIGLTADRKKFEKSNDVGPIEFVLEKPVPLPILISAMTDLKLK